MITALFLSCFKEDIDGLSISFVYITCVADNAVTGVIIAFRRQLLYIV